MCAVNLVIGYACGWFSHKHKQSCTCKATFDSAEKNAYPNEQSHEELHTGELNENIAYGPITIINNTEHTNDL